MHFTLESRNAAAGRALSILYLRCKAKTALGQKAEEKTFNSLFEMQVYVDVSAGVGYMSFQFSI